MSDQKAGFLHRARILSVWMGAAYVAIIAVLLVPAIQSHVLYLHAVKFPFRSEYDNPAKYGIAPGKALNLHIKTMDNVTLGAWYISAGSAHKAMGLRRNAPPVGSKRFRDGVKNHPTVLFLHGNAATRAAFYRTMYYNSLSSGLDANILAIDYRGFGDSTGSPSEDGLAIDARTAFNWLLLQGTDPSQILIYGHSLGTGVGARLAAQLSKEGVNYKGLMLMAPFSSMDKLLETYLLFKTLPLMRPLLMFPGLVEFILKRVVHKFDTLSVIGNVTRPILLAHAENDWDIPPSHSQALFDHLLAPLLPRIPSAETGITREELLYLAKQRESLRQVTVSKLDMDERVATLESFERKGEKVVLLRTVYGGHDAVESIETVVDVIRDTFEW